jgi:hypothetical protein
MSNTDDNFGHAHFPPKDDPSNEETGKAELYPESNQDEVNESYNHNKVLPRVEGEDYTADKEDYNEDSPESKSTFPHKY